MSQRASAVTQRRATPLQAFQQAVSFHVKGRLWEAEQLLETVLKADDRHVGALYHLGLIRLQQRRFTDAMHLLRRAVKIDKNSADAHFHLAVALTGLERYEEAVQRFQKALAIRPKFAQAHNNLGNALTLLARPQEAIVHFEKAVAINPAYAEAHNNLGNALALLGRLQEALASFEKAVAIGPNYVEALTSLGDTLVALDRTKEAIPLYERALAIRPHDAAAHHRLGKLLDSLDRSDEAVRHYEKALSIRPDDVGARKRLGYGLHMLGRSEEALAHYQNVLAISPDDVEARVNLGHALVALGRIEDASQAFEKAISLQPKAASIYLNLANSKRLAADDRHFVALQELARDMASLEVEEQANLHFALGKVFADLGDETRSFQHLLLGNSLKRQLIGYDEAKTLQEFGRIRAVFTAALLHDKRGLGDPSSMPVFIVGMPRSGTTLVEQILASHPKVFGGGELIWLPKLAGSLGGSNADSFPEAMAAVSGEQLRQLGADYLRYIRAMAPAAERITDKLPANFRFAGLIHLALPNARIIHTRRDLRDVALSCFSTLFSRTGQRFSYDLAELGRYCRAYHQLMEHWRNVLPEGLMLEVQYEDLIEDLEGHARRIVAHCGLEWNDACLSFHQTERAVRTASATQVRRPIYQTSVGRWRRHEALLQPLLQALEGS